MLNDKKFRQILSGSAITIAVASLLTFLSLSSGIKNATFSELEKESPLTQITVRPNMENTGVLSLLAQSSKGKLSQKTIDQISKIAGVKNIYPEITFNSFASLEAKVLGFEFVTDTMIFGIEEGFVKNTIPECKDTEKCLIWENLTEPYPSIIPKKLLDIYNFAIAAPQGLPLLSEDQLIGKELKLYPNYSTFFPAMGGKSKEITLKVVGFSDNVNLIGITVPYALVEKLNQEYTTEPSSKFLEIFVETENADQTEEVAKKIETLEYSTSYYQKNLKDVEAKLTYLSIAIGVISGIIVLLAAIAIISTFLASIEEKKKQIGLYRALGAKKSHIRKIFLLEAGITGIIGSISGSILGIIASLVLNKIIIGKLETTTFHPENLFLITPELIGICIGFGIILTLLSAYLPASKAANTSPIEALR
ncbi:MAG: FtsX-like permease family protein [Candidatus Gracilibacteria bacterium]